MPVNRVQQVSSRRRLLIETKKLLDRPLFYLSLIWLVLIILDLMGRLNPWLTGLNYFIWGIFFIDFFVELAIAPDKNGYLRKNWLTGISVLLPVLRIFRVFRAMRLLRAGRSFNLVRMLTSLNRGLRSVRHTMSKRGAGYIFVLTAIVILVGAAGMAQFESPESLIEAGLSPSSGRAGLTSYGDALWWTIMLLTTIGSEYWPRTLEGRILCIFLSLYALGVFGYITATIATFFVGADRADANANKRSRP